MGIKGSATITDASSSIYGLTPYVELMLLGSFMGIKGSPTITEVINRSGLIMGFHKVRFNDALVCDIFLMS